MINLSYETLQNFIRKNNYLIREFHLQTTGQYLKVDAEWNYKDINHTNYVHSKLESLPTLISDHLLNAIHVQNILGINFPMTLTQYEKDDSIIYYSTLFFFIIIVKTSILNDEEHTIVNTTYSICGPKWSKLLIYFLEKIARKNYNILMSEDIPLRDRKKQLRDIGYKFIHDLKKPSWLNLHNLNDNVILTEKNKFYKKIIDINDLKNGNNYIGNSDHYGLRIYKEQDNLHLFQRMCFHEGACLDSVVIQKNISLKCPWHGKVHKPIVSINVNADNFSYSDNVRCINKINSQLIISNL